jgi:hypothetical protein
MFVLKNCSFLTGDFKNLKIAGEPKYTPKTNISSQNITHFFVELSLYGAKKNFTVLF